MHRVNKYTRFCNGLYCSHNKKKFYPTCYVLGGDCSHTSDEKYDLTPDVSVNDRFWEIHKEYDSELKCTIVHHFEIKDPNIKEN